MTRGSLSKLKKSILEQNLKIAKPGYSLEEAKQVTESYINKVANGGTNKELPNSLALKLKPILIKKKKMRAYEQIIEIISTDNPNIISVTTINMKHYLETHDRSKTFYVDLNNMEGNSNRSQS